MKVLIVLNHPYDGSYSYAIADRIIKRLTLDEHEVDFLHLDKEDFNPIMNSSDLRVYSKSQYADPKVGDYQKRIEEADHLVFVFPVWWELMPALLKGFVDKVFTKGWAYDVKHRIIVVRLLKNIRSVTVITTMNTPKWAYWLFFGNAIKKSFINGTLKKISTANVKWINLSPVSHVTREKRESWLYSIENKLAGYVSN